MIKKGIAKNSPTSEAIIRIQRMASERRKEFLGAAVTQTELESVLAWLPEAGDTFETIVAKTNVAAAESEEVFMRFLDLYKDIANMTPFYEAFGLKRFGGSPSTNEKATTTEPYNVGEIYEDEQGRKAKYLGKGKWELQ